MYANGTTLDWRANPTKRNPHGRLRVVRTLTALKCSPNYVVRVERGAPGERGTVHVLSASRLAPHDTTRPAA